MSRATLRLTVAIMLSACGSDAPSTGDEGRGTRGVITDGTPAAANTPTGSVPPAITPGFPAPVGAAGSAPITPPPAAMGAAGVPARPPETPPSAAAGTGSVPTQPVTPPPPMGTPLGTGKTCLKPGNGMYNNPGPYKVGMMEVDLGMIDAAQTSGKFTIYYPEPLEASCLHPIVAWGNGTGVKGSGTYAFLNTNAASWGAVVAESHENNTGSGKFHRAGIDYLLKQNDDPMSKFYKKLTTRAGVSGHSQGGFGANAAASHPNVVTAAIEGASMIASAKVSVLVLTGTADIVKNPENLVTNAKGPMFVGNWEGGDHVTTETVAGAITGDKGALQFSRLYTAWFRCTLGDDAVACKMFMGGAPENCGICKEPGWHSLTSKNL